MQPRITVSSLKPTNTNIKPEVFGFEGDTYNNKPQKTTPYQLKEPETKSKSKKTVQFNSTKNRVLKIDPNMLSDEQRYNLKDEFESAMIKAAAETNETPKKLKAFRIQRGINANTFAKERAQKIRTNVEEYLAENLSKKNNEE